MYHNAPVFYLFRHYGDLGNIEARNGQATVNITDDYVELFGEYDVDGRSFVVCTSICEILSIFANAVTDLHSKIGWALSNFLHFHAVLGKIWPNNRLAPGGVWGWGPPHLGNPRSAAETYPAMHYCVRVECSRNSATKN